MLGLIAGQCFLHISLIIIIEFHSSPLSPTGGNCKATVILFAICRESVNWGSITNQLNQLQHVYGHHSNIRAHMYWSVGRFAHTLLLFVVVAWLAESTWTEKKNQLRPCGGNFDGQQIGIKLRSSVRPSSSRESVAIAGFLKAWPPPRRFSEPNSWLHTQEYIEWPDENKTTYTLVTFHNELCCGTILLLFSCRSCWSTPVQKHNHNHIQDSLFG